MIQEILEAFCGELQELVKDMPGATVLRDTQFDQEEVPAFELPVIILGLSDSPDMAQLSGGVTQASWNWNIRAYFIDSNAELSPDQAFSTGSYAIIETIVNHLNLQTWLTVAFQTVVTNYSFKLAFQDVSKAPALIKKDGGMIPGYQISYSSISLDNRTSFITYSDVTLQNTRQVPFDTLAFTTDVTTLAIAKAAGSTGTFNITANTPWTIISIPPWLSVNDYEGIGNQTITVTATLNPAITNRVGNIVVSAPLSGVANRTIVVTQSGT